MGDVLSCILSLSCLRLHVTHTGARLSCDAVCLPDSMPVLEPLSLSTLWRILLSAWLPLPSRWVPLRVRSTFGSVQSQVSRPRLLSVGLQPSQASCHSCELSLHSVRTRC